jgi:hypothetical protein
MEQTLPIFKDDKPSWQKEWKNMPEYNNRIVAEPVITATFKFRSHEDFKVFKEAIQEHLYHGEKPFDGMQRTHTKSTWFPLNQKASHYAYKS